MRLTVCDGAKSRISTWLRVRVCAMFMFHEQNGYPVQHMHMQELNKKRLHLFNLDECNRIIIKYMYVLLGSPLLPHSSARTTLSLSSRAFALARPKRREIESKKCACVCVCEVFTLEFIIAMHRIECLAHPTIAAAAAIFLHTHSAPVPGNAHGNLLLHSMPGKM